MTTSQKICGAKFSVWKGGKRALVMRFAGADGLVRRLLALGGESGRDDRHGHDPSLGQGPRGGRAAHEKARPAARPDAKRHCFRKSRIAIEKGEDAQAFGERRADDGVGELGSGRRRIAQRAVDEIAENDADADRRGAGADRRQSGADELHF